MKYAFSMILALSIAAFAQIENLGVNINTAFDELAPVISYDGKTLFFIRGDRADAASPSTAYKIFSSRLLSSGWMQAEEMPFPFNTQPYNAVFSATPDGKKLLVLGSYSNGNYRGPGCSLVENVGGVWSKPQEVKIDSFSWQQATSYLMIAGLSGGQRQKNTAFLWNDGRTLIISYKEQEEYGNDLFVSTWSNNSFSRPRSLGLMINSDSEEITPFLAADGQTLYFASDRDGNFDIFMSRRLDNSWRRWSPPVSVGPPINTTGWEAYFSIDAKGEYGYVVSYKNSYGRGDIVRVKMTEQMRPKAPTSAPIVIEAPRIVSTTTATVARPAFTFNDDMKSAYDEMMRKVKSINTSVDDINSKAAVIKVPSDIPPVPAK
ncbi:MAG: hypothetical protein AABZ39_07605 [Spirochaetota bacterium]